MGRFLFFLIIISVVGALGFAGGWVVHGRRTGTLEASIDALIPKAPTPAEAAAAAAKAAAAPPPPEDPSQPPVFVNVGPVTVPIIVGDQVQQFVTLVIALQVDGPAQAERVKNGLPRLQDGFLTALYGTATTKNGLVDIEDIKGKLTRTTLKLMGPGLIRNVLVQVVTQRPL